MTKIVLASASPRRQELLRQIGLSFEVIPSTIEEKIDSSLLPESIVQQLAYAKTSDVANRLTHGCIVIGADTVVVCENKILGKPAGDQEAYAMLRMLSGRTHYVITGFTVIRNTDSKMITDFEKTLVKFRDLSENEIQSYIDTGEPHDKAGAYGIQGMGSLFVEKIDGGYFNVVGLPLSKLGVTLNREFGVKIL